MTELRETNLFKKHPLIVRGILLIGGITVLLGLWLRVWGVNRALAFFSMNFTHILAHIFVYMLLGFLVLFIAPYLLSRPKIYLTAIVPLLILPRLLQLFTTDMSPWLIFDLVSIGIDLLGAVFAFVVFQRLMFKLVVPLFESVIAMTDLAMMHYKTKTFGQQHTDVSSLFANDITDVPDILETLALLATGVGWQSISQIKGHKKEAVLEWLKTANTYRLIIETYLISKYGLSHQQLDRMWSFLALD